VAGQLGDPTKSGRSALELRRPADSIAARLAVALRRAGPHVNRELRLMAFRSCRSGIRALHGHVSCCPAGNPAAYAARLASGGQIGRAPATRGLVRNARAFLANEFAARSEWYRSQTCYGQSMGLVLFPMS
jgi:hypothetical protein